MQKKITIIGAGMMGSALAFPAQENGNQVRLVGTPLDREIINHARETGFHMGMGGKSVTHRAAFELAEIQQTENIIGHILQDKEVME